MESGWVNLAVTVRDTLSGVNQVLRLGNHQDSPNHVKVCAPGEVEGNDQITFLTDKSGVDGYLIVFIKFFLEFRRGELNAVD